MKKRAGRRWMAIATMAALVGFGCGQGSDAPNVVAPAGDGLELAPLEKPAAEKATVTFKVQFPTSGELGKSRLDDNTAEIYVQSDGLCGYTSAYLTPAQPTATFELSPGQCSFYTYSYDNGSYNTLDQARTAGVLKSGNNTVVLTFLRGEWSFVDAVGQAAPIALIGGETLSKFWLAPWSNYAAGKAAIDPSKPMEWTEYSMKWLTGAGTVLEDILGYNALEPYRADTWFDMASQFQGGPGLENNANVVDGGWFNLTQMVGDDYYYEDQPGDRFVAIAGMTPWGGPDQFTPDVTPYLDSTIVDGTTMTGHIIELTFQSSSEVPANPTTGICEGEPLYLAAARSAALKTANTGVGKAANYIGDLTVVSNYCEWVDNGIEWVLQEVTETSTWSDVNFHPFTAKAAQLPVIDWSSNVEVIIQKK